MCRTPATRRSNRNILSEIHYLAKFDGDPHSAAPLRGV